MTDAQFMAQVRRRLSRLIKMVEDEAEFLHERSGLERLIEERLAQKRAELEQARKVIKEAEEIGGWVQ